MRRTAIKCESWSPCEKLSRAMFMPALAILFRVCVVSHAGPIVQMILVWRNCLRSGIGFDSASLPRKPLGALPRCREAPLPPVDLGTDGLVVGEIFAVPGHESRIDHDARGAELEGRGAPIHDPI